MMMLITALRFSLTAAGLGWGAGLYTLRLGRGVGGGRPLEEEPGGSRLGLGDQKCRITFFFKWQIACPCRFELIPLAHCQIYDISLYF